MSLIVWILGDEKLCIKMAKIRINNLQFAICCVILQKLPVNNSK